MADDQGNALSLAPGTVLEEYRIEGILGKGGFAITYSALDLNLDKRVAIKELMPDGIATRVQGMTVVAQTEALKPDFEWAIDSFCKEAKTLAGFDHPNIVTVYRFFRKNGTAYMVMPLIEGSDLKRIIKERGKFSYEDLLAILLPLLDGLREVHQGEVLHRDIKPENIYLTNRGVPILIDFGAARQQISGRSLDVTSIITPGYAAIEQYSTDAKYQGPWSDIYSVAACIYHMITGRKPVSASERSDAARNHQPDPLLPLSELNPPGFPTQFLHGVDQALQLGEKQRPQNVESWMSLLEGAEAPQATPEPPPGEPKVSHVEAPTKEVVEPGAQKKNRFSLYRILALLVMVGVLGFGGFALYSFMDDGATTPDQVNTEGSPESKTFPEVTEVPPESKSPTSFSGTQAGDRKALKVGGVEIVLRWCPAGEFLMGSPESEADRLGDESLSRVKLTQGFWLAETECTQGDWEALMRSNPSSFKTRYTLPVEEVSWEDAQKYVSKLNEAGGLPMGWRWNLPTEAQWEYACRAGTQTPFHFGSILRGERANCVGVLPYGTKMEGPDLSETTEVGSYAPNKWGLYDMHGNVKEWCQDWYDYVLEGGTDPKGPRRGANRVVRGGSWKSSPHECRSATRSKESYWTTKEEIGFRVCLTGPN